jgi:hypothetical protein
MSLFDAIGSFFGGGRNVLGAGAILGGAALSSNANKKAAKEARAGSEANAEAIREGNRLAQARYEDQRRISEPAINYLQRVMAQDPNALTPEQQRGFADYQRGAQARLAASGLRGAGRAGVASVNEGAAGYMADAYGTNQRRSDTAAQRLAGGYFDANDASASLDRDTARAGGMASRDAGYLGANAGTANAAQWGTAMGALANLFAKESKERAPQYTQQKPPYGNANLANFSGGDPAALNLA